MAKRIGVLLSGCGVKDGSEIHEAVLTLLAIDNAGAKAVCMAPNGDQMHVVNHLTGQPVAGARRNMLEEAARIARGDIRDLATVKAGDLDALVIPGGFGAAKNLCTYAVDGVNCKVHPEVARLVREMRAAKKPIGAICIAPVVLAKILGTEIKPSLTIGNDPGTAADLAKLGCEHVNCPVKDCVIDKTNKIVTTPAYMLARSIGEAAAGIEKSVRALIDLA
ncbi:MAG: isoprenoid biosynthesis glyoxalase ElbB [Candidatus Sumerlaeia bacterium]|nr:isoprenoid biosynthesis glyoxalase ElbB [Candidatus Sumerlaeia bacterium]